MADTATDNATADAGSRPQVPAPQPTAVIHFPPVSLSAPRAWCVVEIETQPPGNPQDIDAEFHRTWRPNQKWLEDTVGKRYKEAHEKAKARGALMDCAEIVIVSIKTPCELLVLHCLKEEPPRVLNGATAQGFASGADMLFVLRSWLTVNIDLYTTIIGHNLRFDLNKLRLSYARQGLRLPEALVAAEQSTCCTMSLFTRRFSLSGSPFVSVADACEMVNIKHHKDTLEGSQVQAMIDAGEFDAVLNYAALDASLEADLWLRLTGQGVNLK